MTVLTSTHTLAAHVAQQQSTNTATATSNVRKTSKLPSDDVASALDAVRSALIPFIDGGTSTVVAFQTACGLRRIDRTRFAVGNPLLHAIMRTASACGDELFYIVFLPLFAWLYAASVARRLLFVWFVTYVVGQSIKDALMLPRPPAPPVIRVESHYSAEYGMPSTHAMGALTLPLYLVLSAGIDDAALFVALIALCVVWCATISLSRLYAGVHSAADIIGGLLLGSLCLGFGLIFDGAVEAIVTRHQSALSLIVVSALLILMIYPTTAHWTNAKGDTAIVIGVTAGAFIASNQIYFPHFTALAETAVCSNGVTACITSAAARALLGSCVLFATRFVCKAYFMSIVAPVLLTADEKRERVDPWKCYTTEIPVRVVTYGLVGFNAIFTAPYLFQIANI